MARRIDGHVHVFAKASAEYPRQVNDGCPAEREAPVEALLGEMQAAAIDQAVLVQTLGAGLDQHAYLLDCLRHFPDRFRGIGLIPAAEPEPEQHMDQLAAGGIVGFRLSAIGGPLDPFAAIDVKQFDTYRIWRHAAERDYVIWLYARARDAHLIPYLLEELPQVRVVLNHLGVCPGEGKFSRDEQGRPRIDTPAYSPAYHTTYRLDRYENVAVHLSGQYAFSREAYPYRDLTRWHTRLLDYFGAHRLLWASDFPWIVDDPGYGQLASIIEQLLPDASSHERELIMGESARRLLRFPEPAVAQAG